MAPFSRKPGYNTDVPFPVVDSDTRKAVRATMERNQGPLHPDRKSPDPKDFPKRRVPLDKVVATQSGLYTEHLNKYMAKSAKDRPLVIEHGGKFYMKDGHHRAAADLMKGNTHTVAHVISDDN